jgi:hypothetical protein
MRERKLTDKEARALARWDRFCTEQSGVYPATMAAIKLRMTTQGVYQAAERGWIAYFQIGRDRWYSRRDVCRYLEIRSAEKNYSFLRAGEPKNCTEDDDGGAHRKWNPLRDVLD